LPKITSGGPPSKKRKITSTFNPEVFDLQYDGVDTAMKNKKENEIKATGNMNAKKWKLQMRKKNQSTQAIARHYDHSELQVAGCAC
jgi:hypothetical protein